VHYFNQSIETMPREQLHELQLGKLRSLLHFLDGRNRFYTRKWKEAGVAPRDVQSLSDLKKFPLTAKSELIQAQSDAPPFGTNATFDESAYVRIHSTSGTTGAPLRVVDTHESWDWGGSCWAYVLKGAGVTHADRIFLPFSFGPFIGFWGTVEGAKQIGAMMIPGGGWDSLQRLQAMRELRATVLCCTPTYALRLAEVARREHFDLRSIPIRVLIHAGEPGANVLYTKARIETAWGVQCFDHAGASEVGPHSFECELQPGGMHILESEFIVEVLDPKTREEVGAGEVGELVITNLGRLGYPVVRYLTGDLVRLNTAPCECGRTFSRFEGGLLGRSDDMVTICGVNIYPTAIENVVRRFAEVEEFQITVTMHRELHQLEVQIEVTSVGDPENIRAQVEQAIYHAISLRPRVTLAEPGALARYELKARRFRRLDIPDIAGADALINSRGPSSKSDKFFTR
jgi:phenylacetate-CoA ligase